MTPQSGKQIITIHILPNISRSKSSLPLKFDQLTEYNIKNIFLEELYTKRGGETRLRPFSRKSKLSISLDQQCKNLNCFYSIPRPGVIKTLKVRYKPLDFTSYKTLLKNKKRPGTSLLDLFAVLFFDKNIS